MAFTRSTSAACKQAIGADMVPIASKAAMMVAREPGGRIRRAV